MTEIGAAVNFFCRFFANENGLSYTTLPTATGS